MKDFVQNSLLQRSTFTKSFNAVLIPAIQHASLVSVKYKEHYLSTNSHIDTLYGEFLASEIIEPPYTTRTLYIDVDDREVPTLAGVTCVVVFQKNAALLRLPVNEKISSSGSADKLIHGNVLVCKMKNTNLENYSDIGEDEILPIVTAVSKMAAETQIGH